MTNILLNENGKPMLINNKLVIAGSSNKFVKFSNKIAKTANNKLIRNVKLGRLPSEYQEVEYIEGTGTQYLSIDLTGHYNETPSYEIEFSITDLDQGNAQFFGYATNNEVYPKITYQYNNETGNLHILYIRRSESSQYRKNNITTKFYKVETKIDGKIYIDDQLATTLTAPTSWTTNCGIFLAYEQATSFISKARVKYAKLYANEVLIRHLIPCYRKSDNEVGLYDLVNGVFYINQGTGSFTKGPNIN